MSYKVAAISGLLFLSLATTVIASEDNPNNIGRAFITPNSPLYSFKVIKEDWERKFAGTLNTQIKRELEFSSRRIREVSALIGQKDESLIPSTLERYRFHIEQLNGMSSDDAKSREDFIDVVKNHPDLLIDLYNQSQTKEGKRAILTAIERLQKYVPSQRACEFMNETLKTAELTDSEKAILAEITTSCLLQYKTTKS